jgi:hypothetical protein
LRDLNLRRQSIDGCRTGLDQRARAAQEAATARLTDGLGTTYAMTAICDLTGIAQA